MSGARRRVAQVDAEWPEHGLATSAHGHRNNSQRVGVTLSMRRSRPSRLLKVIVVAVIGGGVLTLNPWFGVTADVFQFEAPEVLAAVEGTWQLGIAASDGSPRTIRFTLAQDRPVTPPHAARGLVRSAAACGRRTLVKSASACIDITEVPLEVVWLAEAGPARQDPATFFVEGKRFHGGHFTATIGDLALSAEITPDGKASDIRILERGAPSPAAATLMRTAR